MLSNSWFKKERPILGLTGVGGGVGSNLVAGAASNDPTGHVASGGVISDYSTPTAAYRAHVFNSPGSFVVTELSSEFPAHVEYVVVGGGSGGGGASGGSQAAGGGGGAGGYKTNMPGEFPGGPPTGNAYPSGYPIAVASYPVSIGAGGAGGQQGNSASPNQGNYNSAGQVGGITYFGPPTARVQCEGGGRGGAGRGDSPGLAPGGDGGSAGGAGFTNVTSWGGTENRATGGSPAPGPSQGNGGPTAGRTGPSYSGPGAGGGGSGAGSDGTEAGPGNTGGPGGDGRPSVIAYGPTKARFYAGGGGGGAAPPTGSASMPTGGSSVGGNGSATNFGGISLSTGNFKGTIEPTVNAVDNTGSGGGGGGTAGADTNGPGGMGANGTVILRYQIGKSEATEAAKATGGAISFYNDKIIHSFLFSEDFVTTSAITNAEVFVIGGGAGGGGGNGTSGGGGAGGYSVITGVAFDNGCTYSAQVGRGGNGGFKGDYRGENGVSSILQYSSGGPSPAFLGAITGVGGGYGGAYGPPVRAGGEGGCGGGGAGNGGSGNQPAANGLWPGPQKTSSDTVGGNSHMPTKRGGGGGGCGGNGSDGDSSGPRNGGIGIQLPTTFRDPAAANALGVQGPDSSYYWVGGGGGGGCEASTPNAEEPADHGKGGGGTGDTGPWSGGGQSGTNTGPWEPTPTSGYNGQRGYANTGGGGGGGWWTEPSRPNAPIGFSGGPGGSGLILIAYPK